MTLVAEHIAGAFTCVWPDQRTETSSSRLDVPPSGRTLRSCGAGTTRTSGHSPTRNSTSCRSRSEERRVGKECRSRWSADHEKTNDINHPNQHIATEQVHTHRI